MNTKYRVMDGVEWINGAKTPENRIVELSELESQYDLQLGRVEPVVVQTLKNTKAD